ncbi:MAG: hypothetical protein ABDH18_05250 [Aquificaceae bacterium]
MRKIVFTITKEGQVFLQAEGYENQECLKSPRVQKLLERLKQEGEIERVELEGQKESLKQEEKLW